MYPGFPFDTGIAATQGVPGLLAGSLNPVGPPFTATEMDVDARAEQAAASAPMQLTATSSWTNLNSFSSRGGKLLFYHGVSDPWFSALDTAVRATGRSWPGRSRLLCPYPSHAHYKGTGDVEDAASFECREGER